MPKVNLSPRSTSGTRPTSQEFSLVRTHSDDEGAVRFAVVCPDPARVLLPTPLRHVPCSALLLLADTTVWQLRTSGHIWSVDRLEAAGELLIASGDFRRPTSELPGHLAYELGMPGVSVLPPNIYRADPGLWETRKIAIPLHLRHVVRNGHSPDAHDLDSQVTALEMQLRAEIEAALGWFRERTDPKALILATRDRFDANLYNYLVHRDHHIARQQLAVGFPALLRAAACGEPDSLGAKMRAAVDARIPLIRFLAKEVAVSQSAVKTLNGQSIEHVGAGWETDLPALLTVLDILRPEDRPRDEPSWLRFNQLVGAASRIFGRRVWHSPFTLAWIREAARNRSSTGTGLRQDLSFIDDSRESLAKAAIIRQSIVEVVEDAIRRHSEADGSRFAARAEILVDRYLAVMPRGRLTRLSDRYLAALDRARAEFDVASPFAQGEENRPLLPKDFTSLDGTRRVTSLITRAALQRHGAALDNCLAGDNLSQYFGACQRGGSFILAVLDAKSGGPLSTAEIRPRQESLSTLPRLTVVQHTAERNRRPSKECRRAITETLALFETSTYRQHLQGVISDNARRHSRRHQTRAEIELPPARLALQRTLGEAGLRTLIEHCRKGATD